MISSFLESPGNFSGPKSNNYIKIKGMKTRVLANKPVNFVFTDRKLHVISVWNIRKHSSDQFARKSLVESQNVSYFLRVASISSAELELLFPITY